MGITSLSPHFSRMPMLSILLAPFQALIALFVPAQSASASARPCGHQPLQYPEARPRLHGHAEKFVFRHRPASGKRSPPARLRIVRAFEPGVGPSCAGRMVISGRMADVCAELDRMALRETTVRQESM